MYRMDRIGPWPLGSLETAPATPTGAAIALASGPHTGVSWFAADASTPLGQRAQTWIVSDDLTLAAGDGVAIGVKIGGQALHNSPEYIIAYGGAIRFFTNDDDLVIGPIVGRVQENSLSEGLLKNYTHVPMMHTAESLARFKSCNGELVIGDFEPSGEVPQTEEYFSGWWITNHGADPGVVSDIRMSFSIQRYEFDLRPFDPNR